MAWLMDWARLLGTTAFTIIVSTSIAMYLLGRTCHWVRWTLPALWALVLLAAPLIPYGIGSSGHDEFRVILDLWSFPAVAGLAPLLGWFRRCASSRVQPPADSG